MRTGVIAKKVGMSRIFSEFGERIPVTILHMDDCRVVSHKTDEKDGYSALQLGFGKAKVKRISNALRGHYKKAKQEPAQKLAEFRIDSKNFVEVGKQIMPSHFVDGQFVDITATTIGKGFAGAMKRHNFGGLEATHGVSISHRSHGSTGQCQDPGRVFKGKKMAGQLGNKQQTTQNLEVISCDDEEGIIVIKGAIPGPKNSLVLVKDAVKKALPSEAVFPAVVAGGAEQKQEVKDETPAAKAQADAPQEGENNES